MKVLNKFLFFSPKTDLLVFVRIIVGLWLAWYGKDVYITEWFESRRISWGEGGLGFAHPELMLYFSKTCEIIFGIFVSLGFLTRLSSFILIIIMSVAVSIGQGWQIFPYETGEITFFYFLFFITFFLIGGGRYSIDYYISRKT